MREKRDGKVEVLEKKVPREKECSSREQMIPHLRRKQME